MTTQLSFIHAQDRQAELIRAAERVRVNQAGGPPPKRRRGRARLHARQRRNAAPVSTPSYAETPCP
jgi:hypothetical protein